MPEKSKRELKREQKLKEENIRKLDEEIKQSKKIPKDYKKKIRKQILLNLVILIFMVIYLVCINVLFLYLDTEVYLKYIQILSVILGLISVVYFELSYKKDNEKLFLYGTEVLVIGLVTLFSNYACRVFFDTYNKILAPITIVVVVYYIIKIFIIKSKMKKKYFKEQNDIREIVKK